MSTRSGARRSPSLVAAALAALGAAGRAAGYPDRPPAAHTGGFGEPTCHACHAGAAPNDGAGSLALDGVPDAYDPGRAYRLTVTMTRAGLAAGGFQLAARFAAGPEAGRQAGVFETLDARVAVLSHAANGVAYAHQTPAGLGPAAPDTARWTLAWRAPARAAGPVVFHAAANAADLDASPLGDFVYTTERRAAEPR